MIWGPGVFTALVTGSVGEVVFDVRGIVARRFSG